MIKKMTITKDELRPGDWSLEVGENYVTVYREIPEFGTSAELTAVREQLAQAQQLIRGAHDVAQRYFYQAQRLEGLGAPSLAHRATVHGERILAALRGEPAQEWEAASPGQVRMERIADAQYWSQRLSAMLDERLADGTSLLAIVIQQNPELAARLNKVLEKK